MLQTFGSSDGVDLTRTFNLDCDGWLRTPSKGPVLTSACRMGFDQQRVIVTQFDQALTLSLTSHEHEKHSKLTCLLQDLLDNSKEHNLSLLSSCDHITVGRLLVQTGREAGAVSKAIALRNALLEV